MKIRKIHIALTDAIIIVFAFVLFSVFVYSLFHYSHISKGTPEIKVVVLFIVPMLSLALASATLFSSPAFKAKLSLLLCSCLVSLYLAETILVAAPSVLGGASTVGDAFDTRSKRQVILDLRKDGIWAYPSAPPATLMRRGDDGSVSSSISVGGRELMPLGGISSVTTVACNESGKFLIYESDRHGFHNPKGLWNRNTWDVAAVGDSFTHGYCVPSDDNYVAQIRELYPGTLNLGMGGNGPLLNLASLLEFLPQLKPRFVLWFHFAGNDSQELEVERRIPLLMRYLNENESFTQELREKQTIVDELLIAQVETRLAQSETRDERAKQGERWRAWAKLSQVRNLLGLTFAVKTLMSPRLFRRILSKAKTTTEGWGGKLLFVYLPHWERYRPTLLGTSSHLDFVREEVLGIAADSGISVLDIHEEFLKHGDPRSLYVGHFNEEGYEVVASAVIRALREAD